jgi:hypothetical protein
MLVVRLVEEDVLAVASVCCPVFQDAILGDAVFCAQLSPKLRTDWREFRKRVGRPRRRGAYSGCLPGRRRRSLFGWSFSAAASKEGQKGRLTNLARH